MGCFLIDNSGNENQWRNVSQQQQKKNCHKRFLLLGFFFVQFKLQGFVIRSKYSKWRSQIPVMMELTIFIGKIGRKVLKSGQTAVKLRTVFLTLHLQLQKHGC